MAVPSWLKRILHHYAVPYEEHRHPAIFHASNPDQANELAGYRAAKTVYLSAEGHPVAVVLPQEAEVDLPRVEAVLGSPELHFASEAELAGWFRGCPADVAPPLRLRSDECVLMDRSLASLGKMIWPAGTPDDAIAMRFRDWYRAVRPGVGQFARPTREHSHDPESPTVLVIEDEKGTNELFCRLLEREGFTCHGAEQGMQALTLAAQFPPSAILLDLMLPDMSGFDVYERLRRIGPIKRTPVIIVSALDDEASRQRGRQLGAEAYLTKPFLPERLVTEVNAVLADA